MFFSFREVLYQLLARDVFIGVKFAQNLLLHCTYPRFWFESEKHRNVVFGRVAHPVVQQSPANDIRIQLQIFPVLESEVLNSVQQFLLLLDKNMLIECFEDIRVFFERFVQHEILNPTVFYDLFFATCDTMFIDFENKFRIIGLGKETNADDVACLQFMDDSIDRFLRKRQSLVQNFGGFRTLGTKQFKNFYSKGLMRVTDRYCFPFCWSSAVKFSSDFKGHILRIVIS